MNGRGGGGGRLVVGGGGQEDMEEDGARGLRKDRVVLMWGYLPGVSPLLGPVPVRLPPAAAAGDGWRDVCGGGCGFAMAISGDASRSPFSLSLCLCSVASSSFVGSSCGLRYRLKAKKKMKSPNLQVRIRYKLEKRKEEWLIEKLRKYEVPSAPEPVHNPEILTEEEKFDLKRTGEKKKNYVPVGRRGVFGGVVLNMHLHWKKHETVKVVCKPCRPGQVYEYA